MALVRDECLLPCKDAPELGFVKESSPEQYVPDVFFKVRLVAQDVPSASSRDGCGDSDLSFQMLASRDAGMMM